MILRIRQGGQTGVDRGAWLGAVDACLPRCGWMPANRRDESGPIPGPVQADLRPRGSLRERTIANVADASAVVIVVPDWTMPLTNGTELTYWNAVCADKLRFIVDPSRERLHALMEWWHALLASWRTGPELHDLMIAGPRASKWPGGEQAARHVVSHIAGEADAARGGLPLQERS